MVKSLNTCSRRIVYLDYYYYHHSIKLPDCVVIILYPTTRTENGTVLDQDSIKKSKMCSKQSIVKPNGSHPQLRGEGRPCILYL